MKNKRCALFVGTLLGAISGTLAYSFLKQKRFDPFKDIADIRNKYASMSANETQIEADQMLSEGGQTVAIYENQKQEG